MQFFRDLLGYLSLPLKSASPPPPCYSSFLNILCIHCFKPLVPTLPTYALNLTSYYTVSVRVVSVYAHTCAYVQYVCACVHVQANISKCVHVCMLVHMPAYGRVYENERERDRDRYRLTERQTETQKESCLLYTSPSPRDRHRSRMPSSA